MDYLNQYENLVIKAKNRQWTKQSAPCYVELHHILPKCIGGIEKDYNLIYLTAKEHFIAHILLAKEFPEEKGLWFSVFRMMYPNNNKQFRNYKINSKIYEQIRQNYANEQSRLHSGKNVSKETVNKIISNRRTYKGENNPNFGKTVPDSIRQKMSENRKDKIAVKIRGIHYDSIIEAKQNLGISDYAAKSLDEYTKTEKEINNFLNNENNAMKRKEIADKFRGANNKNSKPIIIENMEFESIFQATETLKISRHYAYKLDKNNNNEEDIKKVKNKMIKLNKWPF